MRKPIAVAALVACTAAAPAGVADATDASLATATGSPRSPPDRDFVCNDRIDTVRAERGLPMLDKRSVSPDEPLLIAAVDKRIDGCSALVMRRNTSDVRPIPRPDERTSLRPAR